MSKDNHFPYVSIQFCYVFVVNGNRLIIILNLLIIKDCVLIIKLKALISKDWALIIDEQWLLSKLAKFLRIRWKGLIIEIRLLIIKQICLNIIALNLITKQICLNIVALNLIIKSRLSDNTLQCFPTFYYKNHDNQV